MKKPIGKLTELARRAGQWLGLAAQAPTRHTVAVDGDRFDTMTWQETREQATALGDLGDELSDRFDYVDDLMRDVFLSAYKTEPRIRDAADMEPSRLPNHRILSAMVDSPEFRDLHRETAGDEYAAAMAVIAQSDALRRMLEQAKDAQTAADAAAQAQQEADERAQDVADALDEATEQADDEGNVPAGAGQAVDDAIAAAEAAHAAAQQAHTDAETASATLGAQVRAAARQAAADAAEQARNEQALMAAWGIGPGQLQRMSFEQRATLAQQLRSGRLGAFADLIGRFRQMATGERARKTEHAPGELVGITLGDDLSRLIPSEAATLGVPILRSVFAARYAEKQLMLYETRGEDTAGRGAIIACVDCSYSMSIESPGPGGQLVSGEAWAKACALALLDQARAADRDFVGILFSSGKDAVSVHRFPADVAPSIGDVIEFAETFQGGGTDFEAPLGEAVQILAEQYNDDGAQRGDIVIITDGEAAVSEDWMAAWNAAKAELGFRLFGVAIQPDGQASAGYGGVLEALCDNLRGLGDLTEPRTAADLFRVI